MPSLVCVCVKIRVYPYEEDQCLVICTFLTAAIVMAFLMFNFPIRTEECPLDCIPQCCSMQTVKGRESRGPCQCVKENSTGPPVAFCSNFKLLENPTIHDRLNQPMFFKLMIVMLVCSALALWFTIKLEVFQLIYRVVRRARQKSSGICDEVTKG